MVYTMGNTAMMEDKDMVESILGFIRLLRRGYANTCEYNELYVEQLFERLLKQDDGVLDRKSAWLAARMLECERFKKSAAYGKCSMENTLKGIYAKYRALRKHVNNYWYHDRGMGSTDLIIADAQERARYRAVKKAYRWVNWGKNKQKQEQV